jgi:hypothetical protein
VPRMNTNKILSAFLKVDAIEKNQGYRIDGSGQQVGLHDSKKRNDVTNILKSSNANYQSALVQDEIQRQRIAQNVQRAIPQIPSHNPGVMSVEKATQIDNARKNPQGQIYDSNGQIVKSLIEQNKLLQQQIELLKSRQPKKIIKAPMKIVK